MNAPAVQPVKFTARSTFKQIVTEKVNQHFKEKNLSPHATGQQITKVFVLFLWLIASYVALVFFATAWWQTVLLSISAGLAAAGIGFCVQHDANHGSFSKRKWVNYLAGCALDVLGGSSYLWKNKHNVNHHTYTNIVDHDDDINTGILGRLAPDQPRYWFHQWQHIYLWFFYGLLVAKWQLVDDWVTVIRGRDGNHPVKRPRGLDLVIFIGGKLFFYTWALVIPSLFHPVWQVALVYLLASWCMGIVLAVVFQLAHVVEETEFPTPQKPIGSMEFPWAEHQVRTTANFAPRSRFLTWFLGGLNYQIEHHLFPWIAHAHYPQISRCVQEACRECDLPYHSHPTMFQAVYSHYKLLKAMGKPVAQ
jgi:linoleoyl-CoA desaturase